MFPLFKYPYVPNYDPNLQTISGHLNEFSKYTFMMYNKCNKYV